MFNTIKYLLIDIFSGPNGQLSSKRLGAWICLFMGLYIQYKAMNNEIDHTVYMFGLITFMGVFLGALGITAVDIRSMFMNSVHNEPQVPIGFQSHDNPIIASSEQENENDIAVSSKHLGFKIKK